MKTAMHNLRASIAKPAQALMGVVILMTSILALPACESASKQEMAVMRSQVANIDKKVGHMADMVANLDQLQNIITTLTGQIEELNVRSVRLSEKIGKIERGGSSQNDIQKRVVATNIRLEKLNDKLNTLTGETMAFIVLMEKRSGISKKSHKKALKKIMAKNGVGAGNGRAVPKGDKKKKAATTASVSPEELYKGAYNEFLSGSYKAAISGFSDYLTKYPNTDLSDNAAYWLGESKYRVPDYAGSVKAFDQMALRYPKSNKAPAAMLRSATASFKNGDNDGGLERLRSILEKYPTSNEALTASEKLDQTKKKSN